MVGYAEDDNIINQKSHFKSNLDSLTREFDELVRETFESNVKYGIYLPPASKSVFDFFLDAITGNFVEWNHLLPHSEFLIKQSRIDDLIPTVDSVRFAFLSSLLLSGKHPVLISGQSGIGKTATLQHMLKRLGTHGFSHCENSILGEIFNYSEPAKNIKTQNISNFFAADNADIEARKKSFIEDLSSLPSSSSSSSFHHFHHFICALSCVDTGVLCNNIQFSAQTTSSKFLTMFVSKMVKKGANLLSAPRNKCIVTFIDDLNLPVMDKFGDQPPIELLRFIIENCNIFKFENFKSSLVIHLLALNSSLYKPAFTMSRTRPTSR